MSDKNDTIFICVLSNDEARKVFETEENTALKQKNKILVEALEEISEHTKGCKNECARTIFSIAIKVLDRIKSDITEEKNNET